MDYRSPVHAQLRELLREKIETGEIKEGEAIPSERELAATYNLNRLTVRNGISALVEEGLLKKVQGKGTFVIKPKIERDLFSLQGFNNILVQKGIQPSTKLLYAEQRAAGRKYARIFGVEEETKLFNITRLRLGGGEPYELEDTYILYDEIAEVERIDFQNFSLYEAFRLNGIKLDRGEQTLKLVKVEGEEAKLLQIPDGSSVFLFECQSYDENNKTVEVTRAYTRGDKCNFYAELK